MLHLSWVASIVLENSIASVSSLVEAVLLYLEDAVSLESSPHCFWKMLCRLLGESNHKLYPTMNSVSYNIEQLGKTRPLSNKGTDITGETNHLLVVF